MGSSYYVTYGTNRLTFGGPTGSIAWEYTVPTPKTDTVTQLWRNTGSAVVALMPLSDNAYNYDALLVEFGRDEVQQTLLWPISNSATDGVSATGCMTISRCSPGSVGAFGWNHYGIRLDVESAGAYVREKSSYRQSYRTWGTGISAQPIYGISGVKYAK